MHPLWLLEHQISTQSLEGLSFPNCASRGRLLIIWKDSQEIYRDGKGVLAEGRAIFLKGDPCSRDSTQSLHRWTEHHGIPSCEITHFEHRAFLYLQVLGSFHQGIFLGGGGWNLSSFICLCVSQKHWEGSWAGTCGALSFPTQGLVSQHPLGLASPWRADDAEFLVRCTNSYPASC